MLHRSQEHGQNFKAEKFEATLPSTQSNWRSWRNSKVEKTFKTDQSKSNRKSRLQIIGLQVKLDFGFGKSTLIRSEVLAALPELTILDGEILERPQSENYTKSLKSSKSSEDETVGPRWVSLRLWPDNCPLKILIMVVYFKNMTCPTKL